MEILLLLKSSEKSWNPVIFFGKHLKKTSCTRIRCDRQWWFNFEDWADIFIYQNFVRTGILTSSLFFENKSAIPSTCIYTCKSDLFQSEFDDPLDVLNVYELYMLMFVIFNFRFIKTKIYLTFRIFCNQHVINV